jgi:hypothetical protein
MGVCTISQAEAVIIFLSRSRHGSYGSRGNLSDRLSKEFGITPKGRPRHLESADVDTGHQAALDAFGRRDLHEEEIALGILRLESQA